MGRRTLPYTPKNPSAKRFKGVIARNGGGKVLTPMTLTRTLRYTDLISINPQASGAAGAWKFSANGVYDPDLTSTGHQPLGFDQYMLMYEHYRVKASKITVTIVGSQGAATDQLIAAVYLDDDTTSITDATVAIEQGLTSYAVLNSGAGANSKVLTKSYERTRYGVKDDNWGTDGGNPSDTVVYHILVAALDGSSDPGAVNMLVNIDYVVEFQERKTLAQS